LPIADSYVRLDTSSCRAPGKYNTNGNIGLALYYPTGEVYLQVYVPAVAGQPTKAIFEARIRKCRSRQAAHPTQIGNEVEEPVTELVPRATGPGILVQARQPWGPDLVAP
jgi:hypothetical protein